jgi:hypothetical protein
VPTRTKLTTVSILTAAGCLLAGCSSGSSGAAATQSTKSSGSSAAATAASTSSDAGNPSGSTSPSGSISAVSVRIANLYVSDSLRAGPGLDLYDVQLTGQAVEPIATDVPYGSFSAYVHPHLVANAVTKIIQLSVLPTGENPVADMKDAKSIGALIDDGSGAQETILLANDLGGLRQPDVLDALSFSSFVEKGDDGNGGKAPVAPAAPGGQGELLASTQVLTSENLHGGAYLMIDSACDEPLNHDPNSTGVPEIFATDTATYTTGFALFPVAAGSHQVSVVWSNTSVAPTCARLTAKQGETSVDATAGQQSLVFVYGTSLTDLHLAVGPIQ